MRKVMGLLLVTALLATTICSYASAEGMTDTSLLLPASAAAPLSEKDEPADLKQIASGNEGVHLVTSRSMMLREVALTPLYRLMKAAEDDGLTLYVRQAYRSYAEEERRYEMLTSMGSPAQKPGESSYQTGLSVTLVGEDWKTRELTEEFADSPESVWLSQHAAEYGFVLRYPEGKVHITGWSYEPWHYRFVGVQTANEMSAQGLCLEELAVNAGLVIARPQLPEEDAVEEEPDAEAEPEEAAEADAEAEPDEEAEPEEDTEADAEDEPDEVAEPEEDTEADAEADIDAEDEPDAEAEPDEDVPGAEDAEDAANPADEADPLDEPADEDEDGASGAAIELNVDESLLHPASARVRLSEKDEPDDLKQISSGNEGVHLVTNRSMMLREEALNALYQMLRAAAADGQTIYVRQAYRSYAEEARRCELLTGMGEESQQPGESSYQTGLSVTLVGEAWKTQELTEAFADSLEAMWLSQHAAEYGFVLRYPVGKEDATGWQYEPWHYRYVGKEAAMELTARDMCLDELVEALGLFQNAPDEEEEGGEDGESPAERKEHSAPPAVDLTGIDPEDFAEDGDYDISLFGN